MSTWQPEALLTAVWAMAVQVPANQAVVTETL